jgi:hypothetical protein
MSREERVSKKKNDLNHAQALTLHDDVGPGGQDARLEAGTCHILWG